MQTTNPPVFISTVAKGFDTNSSYLDRQSQQAQSGGHAASETLLMA